MKMSREQLKALVKECLLEILSEGLGGNVPISRQPQPSARMQESRSGGRSKPAFDSRLDTPMGGGRQATDALRQAIKQNAGGNPIMESIFADTAATTLPSMLSHGDVGTPPPGMSVSPGSSQGPVQQEQFNGAPEEVFEGSSRWANLAFMGPDKKTA
jgi:hypothetical protein